MVAGAGLEPACRRLMRPLPYLLATPQFGKVARRLGAAPSPRSFGDSAAQAGARRVVGFANWSDQPDLHRHPLNGVQESWLLDDDRE